MHAGNAIVLTQESCGATIGLRTGPWSVEKREWSWECDNGIGLGMPIGIHKIDHYC